MRKNLSLLALLAVLLNAGCQTQPKPSQLNWGPEPYPLVILTDMEPDDRIALMLASDLLAERLTLVGTGVRHAARKRELAARLFRQEYLDDLKIVQGTGGDADAYPDEPGTRPGRLYQDEGKGILSDAELSRVKKAPHSSDRLQAELIEVLENHNAIEIIALAPLTDLAALLENRPDLVKRIARLHIMGGWTERAGINRTSYNWTMDAKAAKWILDQQDIPIVLYPSDLFKQVFSGGSLNRVNAPRVISALQLASQTSANMQDFTKAATSWDRHVMTLIPALAERIGPHAGRQFSPSDPFTVLAVAMPDLILSARPVEVSIEPNQRDPGSSPMVRVQPVQQSHVILVEKLDRASFLLALEQSFLRLAHGHGLN